MILYSTNAYLKADHDNINNISLRQILFEKSQKMWYFIVFSPECPKNITFFAISQKVFVLQICYLHHHVRLFNPHSQSIISSKYEKLEIFMVVRFLATLRAEIPRFPSSKIKKNLATQVYSLFAPCVKSAKRYLKKSDKRDTLLVVVSLR